jgi:hypothetical protein
MTWQETKIMEEKNGNKNWITSDPFLTLSVSLEIS